MNLLIHANPHPHRIAARPPLSQPDSRTMAVTISYGLNDEYLLQRCSSIYLKRQGGDWYSHLLTNNSRTNERTQSLHAHRVMPLTIADPMRKRLSRIQQIPYDAHCSATHPNDLSAADARDRRDGLNSSPEDVARVKKKKIERVLQTCPSPKQFPGKKEREKTHTNQYNTPLTTIHTH
jgi:hypothetical protein